MLNKWKEELNAKFKKKDGPPNASDTVSNQSAPQNNNQQPAPQQVAFSLNTMDEFTHEELQQVIKKYDAGLQRYKATMQEKNEKLTNLEQSQAKLLQ